MIINLDFMLCSILYYSIDAICTRRFSIKYNFSGAVTVWKCIGLNKYAFYLAETLTKKWNNPILINIWVIIEEGYVTNELC